MRVVKDAAERRNEILDVAEELFAIKGYEETSTNDILERVGIARGTLYYHFKSKEEILDSMIDRMNAKLLSKAAKVANDKSIPVIERITLAVMAMNVESDLGEEVMEQVHKPGNALMHQKMQQTLVKGIVPIISGLVEEGIAEGLFQTDFIAEAVEMIMIYSNTAFDELWEQSPDEQMRRLKGFIYNVERLFGAEQGTMQQAIMKIFEPGITEPGTDAPGTP